jgi:D-aminoacyl-tRNA deacylase
LIIFIASKQDTAGMNIANQLIKNYQFKKTSETFQDNPVYIKTLYNKESKLLFVEAEIVQTQFLETLVNPQLMVFLSRHSSAKGVPTLSVHAPGNLSEAKFGGKPKTVSVSPARAMKNALCEMDKQVKEKKLEYEVSYEVTHHGPSLNFPSMFVELGSSPEQWIDIEAAKVVADSAVAAVSDCSVCPAVVGIGGPHYNKKFTKLAINNERAFGHMIPKYAIDSIDAEIIEQCVNRTQESIKSVVLDWKGIKGEHKPKIVDAMGSLGLDIEKI